ncbi:MAG: hypothetical protein ABFD00_01715 [Chloroherpetonaceae bacterium]
MTISGFTFVKNATKLYYPIKQSILSIIPIVDEYVVALGDCDADDRTIDEIQSINSSKIKIINTVWDTQKYSNGTENAHQTDIAKSHCSGDWLFYLQADEVCHEKDLPKIQKRCEELYDNKEVEGLLFRYLHFWGDYWHYHKSHSWYANEIRIIRNDKDIHSWESAQSFRRIPNFDGVNFRQKEGTFKLKVATVDADIYHYGWVRPPELMQRKSKALDSIHKGDKLAEEIYNNKPAFFDYGYIGGLKRFEGTHPKVMQEFIEKFNWGDKLNYTDKTAVNSFKHNKMKDKILSFIENNLFNGEQVFGFRNWIKMKL